GRGACRWRWSRRLRSWRGGPRSSARRRRDPTSRGKRGSCGTSFVEDGDREERRGGRGTLRLRLGGGAGGDDLGCAGDLRGGTLFGAGTAGGGAVGGRDARAKSCARGRITQSCH